MTEQFLSKPYGALNRLEVDAVASDTPAVSFIQAKIFKSQNLTQVRVTMINGSTRYLEWEFPLTEVSELESAIA